MMPNTWSFRRQLVTLIALMFILGAVVLLLVQYFIVREIVSSQVAIGIKSAAAFDCEDDPLMCGLVGVTSEEAATAPYVDVSGVSATRESIAVDVAQWTDTAVGGQLLFWSAVVLVVFAVLSVIAANWLAGRTLQRVSAISDTAREITGSNRSARLKLDGPEDEIKSLADTIDAMLERLDVTLLRQERFLAAASHELRTPIATVRTALEVPLVQGRFVDDVRPAVDRALAANNRSVQLLETLTTLSRAQLAGGSVFSGDLGVACAGALRDVQELAERSEISIQGAVPAANRELSEDELLMSVAVGNLLRNAIVHNVKGGEVWVEVSERSVTVANSGEILTDSEVKEFSQPFNRGENTRLAGGGMGLGLTVVEAIIDHFAGSLELEARGEGGLIASLTLRDLH